MDRNRIRIALYALVFFSGAAGLTYQIVWTRMLLLTFGSTTHSVIAVLSAFMAGLALGSWGIGSFTKNKHNHLQTYAFLELVIGLSAILSPFLFAIITRIYVWLYPVLPESMVLQLKFFLTMIVLLPPTVAMGATIPLLLEFLKSRYQTVGAETSRLYALNTYGACAGVLLTAYVLIESIGLRSSVFLAAATNLLISGLVYTWSKNVKLQQINTQEADTEPEQPLPGVNRFSLQIALGIFSVSGLLGMAYEIAWTRLLTPTTGTYIYAFSAILAVLLFGIATGSLLYPALIRLKINPIALFGFVQCTIGAAALSSLFATSHITNFSHIPTVLLTILPASLGMGLTFPIIASLTPTKTSISAFVGKAYALNTLGSMAGPLVAGFLLMPVFGSIRTILMLAVGNFLFTVILFSTYRTKRNMTIRYAGIGAGILGITTILFVGAGRPDLVEERTTHALKSKLTAGRYNWAAKEDETAAVLGYNNGTGDYGLLVDGVGMSVLVDETKLMSHLPLLIHPDPKDVLVIAFGMGTTYRSALTYDVHVDAVELVPSVPEMFPIFFRDADAVMSNPKGKVIINDGRNFVKLTPKRYDVITVDPPPPVNAAGTTVLYSKEFYDDSRRILKPGGLFTEWFFYGTRADDFQYLLRSFTDVFPYIAVFGSPRAIGIYLIGSDSPIDINQSIIDSRFKNPKVRADLNEWGYWDEKNTPSLYIGDKSILMPFIADAPPVTDDRPRTEYFLLRHKKPGIGIARNEVLFPNKY